MFAPDNDALPVQLLAFVGHVLRVGSFLDRHQNSAVDFLTGSKSVLGSRSVQHTLSRVLMATACGRALDSAWRTRTTGLRLQK